MDEQFDDVIVGYGQVGATDAPLLTRVCRTGGAEIQGARWWFA